jgi:hypothetical protein
MKVQFHTNGVSLTADQRELVATRLAEEFSHAARFVNHVNVYLHDCNGSKSGVDKTCRLVVHLRRRPPVVIRDEGSELLPLIYRVLERCGHALQRRTATRRERVSPISMSGQ